MAITTAVAINRGGFIMRTASCITIMFVGAAGSARAMLATFDRGLRTLAGDEFSSALEIVPTR